MKKILFVEDDVLVVRIYTERLTREGFEVAVAEDGLAAVRQLPVFKPDLVVLDLLMPKLNGADVLKFLRGHPDLKNTRVIVFSNSFLVNLVDQIAAMGVEKTLVKSVVTPPRLIEVINEVLEGPGHTPPVPKPPAAQTAPSTPSSAPAKSSTQPPASKPPAQAPAQQVAVVGGGEGDSQFLVRAGRQFLERTPLVFADLRRFCAAFLEATDPAVQTEQLTALNRKLGFLTQMCGMAGFHRTSELTSALEALIYELIDNPAAITDSCRQTIAAAIAFLANRFERPSREAEQTGKPPVILVVDDDPVSSKALVQALARAKLKATSLSDSQEALKVLEQATQDVVLLDINMPGMDGLALCEKMRHSKLNQRTPVVFVTSHSDFKMRARSILSGGNDLITKPIFPLEVCVKVIMHLLKGS